MNAAKKLPSYTKAEAWRLEDIYLNGYKAEGLIGKGKVPANDNERRQQFNLTPAGRARQLRAEARKEQAYNLIAQGHSTVREVKEIMGCTDTPVRRYFRILAAEGRIELVEHIPGVLAKWRAK